MSLPRKLDLAIQKLRIADVTLKSITARLDNEFVPVLVPDDQLSYQVKLPVCRSYRSLESADDRIPVRKHIFEVFAALRFVSRNGRDEPDNDPELCATVESEFLVFYDEHVDGEALDEECIALYAQHNVPFSVWPYWREVVQSACGRMGLPRVVLPTHRLRRIQTDAQNEALVSELQEKLANG